MINFIIGFIGSLAIVILILNLLTNLSKQDKLKVIYLFLSVAIIAGAYEFFQNKKANKDREVVLKYMHGESFECRGLEINKSTFNFVNGTLSFVGKEENNKNIVISVGECE